MLEVALYLVDERSLVAITAFLYAAILICRPGGKVLCKYFCASFLLQFEVHLII